MKLMSWRTWNLIGRLTTPRCMTSSTQWLHQTLTRMVSNFKLKTNTWTKIQLRNNSFGHLKKRKHMRRLRKDSKTRCTTTMTWTDLTKSKMSKQRANKTIFITIKLVWMSVISQEMPRRLVQRRRRKRRRREPKMIIWMIFRLKRVNCQTNRIIWMTCNKPMKMIELDSRSNSRRQNKVFKNLLKNKQKLNMKKHN